jgi:hypothetical protein
VATNPPPHSSASLNPTRAAYMAGRHVGVLKARIGTKLWVGRGWTSLHSNMQEVMHHAISALVGRREGGNPGGRHTDHQPVHTMHKAGWPAVTPQQHVYPSPTQACKAGASMPAV